MNIERRRNKQIELGISDSPPPTEKPLRLLGSLVILSTVFFHQFASASSGGYLSKIGPAPLRFEKSGVTSAGDADLAIMKPYDPPLFNPSQSPSPNPNPTLTPQKKTNLVATVKIPGPSVVPTSTNNPSLGAIPPDSPHEDQTVSMTTNQVGHAVNDITAPLPLMEHEETPPSGAIFQAAPMSPQMLMHFFQSRSTGEDGAESGVIIPMVFTPPQAPPPRSSKAVYQRSPN